jgi:hypothetical protein
MNACPFFLSTRVMPQTLAELKVATHPDETFLGRTARGFDFLGYRFGAEGLTGVAEATVERFVGKATRLASKDVAGNTAPGQRLPRDLSGGLAALVERFMGGEMPAETGSGEGAPPIGRERRCGRTRGARYSGARPKRSHERA